MGLARMRTLGLGRVAVLALVASLGTFAAALAQSPGSYDKRSDGRFTGMAFITDDPRWYELLMRPELPKFEVQDEFGPGETGALAIMFSNAEPRQGTVRIECDVTALDPTGSSLVVDGGVCYEGPYNGDNILHAALLDLQFKIGPNDPRGQSGFAITLRDVHSSRSVKLNVAFTQGSDE